MKCPRCGNDGSSWPTDRCSAGKDCPMQEPFVETKAAWGRLTEAWVKLDASDQHIAFITVLGVLMMVNAVIWSFGWPGAEFVAGALFFKLGNLTKG